MSHSYPIRRLALSCSALALATALATPAQAQSFQGNANVVFGSANVVQGSGTTNVNVTSQSAVIDWTPFDSAVSNGAPINWQPTGTQANFVGQSANFAVLNRIVPTDTSRPITFNGTVVSRYIQGQVGFTGGTLFFYSPGGIVLSPTAVFDIGNLGLTTAPPVVGPNGDWYTNNTVQFGQSISGRAISIQPGAQIGATAQGSYVAAFAPRIEQYGNISVNGQAALVGGEAGSITFSPDGLFNIQVSVGSDQAVAIEHRGTTTGPASGGAGDNHRIFMVAVPKNNAMQLTIARGSRVGFDIAGAANVQGNAVVLSAGYNVTGGQTETARAGSGGLGTLVISDISPNLPGTGFDFTSAVNGQASYDVYLTAFRQSRFASDVYLRGDRIAAANISAFGNSTPGQLTFGGNLTISANRPGAPLNGTGDAGEARLTVANDANASIAGILRIEADSFGDLSGDGVATGGIAYSTVSNGSQLSVGQDFVISANAISNGAVGAPDAKGGSAQLALGDNTSSVSVAGVTRVHSYGLAGLNIGASGQGRLGTGGFSSVSVGAGSTFTTNQLNIAADGVGGADVGAGGGRGVGGTAQFLVTGANSQATITSGNVTGDLNLGERDFLSAEGFGGQTATANGVGGSAQGGSAALQVSGGGRLTLPTNTTANQLRILGRATGGNVLAGTAGNGGAAQGGSVSLFLDAGTLTGGQLLASSFAMAGGSTNPAVASSVINGGSAVGGTRTITIQNGSSFSAGVTGGPGAQGGNASVSGRGGDGTGGTASTVIDNSVVNVPALGFGTFSQNSAGEGAIYGNASGGSASLVVRNGATVNLAAGATFAASAGNSTFPRTGPFLAQGGGNAVAGNAVMEVINSTITGNGTIGATASASADHMARVGGNATGGAARLNISGSTVSVAQVTVEANGSGGEYAPTSGFVSGVTTGSGSGGIASVTLSNASSVTANGVTISADGEGGRISADGVGSMTTGAGTGGSALLQITDSALTQTAGSGFDDNAVTITANGTAGVLTSGDGGGGVTSGRAGVGTGGTARFILRSAAVAAEDVELDAVGSGGEFYVAQGTDLIAGNGIGGIAAIQADAGTSTIVSGEVDLGSDGSGGSIYGNGGSGGSGTGGQSRIDVTSGAALTIDGSSVSFSGEGQGGDVTFFDGAQELYSGTGGAAVGGLESISASGGSLAITGEVNFEGEEEAGAGVVGGAAVGGTSSILAQNGGAITIAGEVELRREAFGGNGLTGGTATGGLAYLQASSGGSIAVTGGGTVVVTSNAYGGFDEYGLSGSQSSGGAAVGGTAQILASNGDARLSIDGGAYVYSGAFGGGSNRGAINDAGTGGAATGGLAEIGGSIGTGNVLTIAGEAFVTSAAEGGYGEAAAGGNATGGRALITAGNGTALSLNSLILSAGAIGGDVISSRAIAPPAGTRGGDAVGGIARLATFGSGGSIQIANEATIDSLALGGSADFTPGEGGDAFAGFADVFSGGGMVSIGGSLILGVETEGGLGLVGGDAGILDEDFFRAGITAQNGTVAVTGQTFIYGTAAGGAGVDGGAGGSALAASAYVDADSSTGGSSTITLSDLQAYTAAAGGEGGSSGSGAGGAGGTATATGVEILGTAGNGNLVVTGTTQLFAVASGGAGGASETAAGGAGGAANSGRITVGTKSGAETGPANTGSASFANVAALSEALGGAGGNSDIGAGGAGGSGVSFGGVLQVRGSPVTADAVSITAFGIGGSGGAGATLGAGGYGAGGQVDFSATQRFERSERGSANIGSLSLLSLAQGGTGSTTGATYYAGGGGVFLTQSDVTIGSLSYSNLGDLPPPPELVASVQPVSLQLAGANLTVDTLTMTTPGTFLLNLDSSTITANSFAISAGTFVLPPAPPAVPGTITVRDSLSLAATAPGGSVRTYANVISNNAASFSSFDSIVLGDIDVDGLFSATSQTGTVTVGDIEAGSAQLTAQGNVQAGNVQVGGAFTASSTAGGVTVGTINAASANLSGPGYVQTGNVLTSGPFVALSSAGSVTTGAVTAANANLLAATNLTAGPISVTGPLNLQATSGSISLSTVNATVIQFASGAGFTANTIGATSIAGNTGGTLAVLGAWSAPSISISANDIAISDGGSLAGGPNGTINLLSRNEQGAFIGDGLAGQGGYRLSNAEFGRIAANSIFIGARDLGNAVDMTIGNLAISPSQIPGSEGSVEFATGILETQQVSGRIRIDGAITGSGLSASQYLSFPTGSFELNAETGSIALSGNGLAGLGGIVEIEADNIHVASPAILAKLRADPRYAGVADEINAPAAVQRPDGVLRALGIQFFPSDTIYIQNTGTASNPAGFYATADESDIEPPGFEDPSAPDVDAIINGRFATASGDISGQDVFEAISDDEETTFEGFSASSQVNGCTLGGEACGGPVSPDNPELAVLQSEFELLSGQAVEEEPFDLDESSEEEEEESEQAARAPIEPPVILIDTRPLNPPLDIVDPVSGSGNPASPSLDPVAEDAGDAQ